MKPTNQTHIQIFVYLFNIILNKYTNLCIWVWFVGFILYIYIYIYIYALIDTYKQDQIKL